MSALLDAAFSYIESSPQWKLFPAHPKTKRPLIKTGRDHAEYASTDPSVIERWITREFRGCAIAMPTGLATWTVVVDIDAKHDGATQLAALEEDLGPLPRERVARTQNSGEHIYCAHPGDARVRTGQGERSPLGYLTKRPGLDVRADGGIVVLPPSPGYRWIADDDTLPPLPLRWLLAINGAGEPPPPPRPTIQRRADRAWADPDRGDPIHAGDRNGALFRIGVAVHFAGATDGELLDHLERVNAARCNPALPAREVAKIAASAARAQGKR